MTAQNHINGIISGSMAQCNGDDKTSVDFSHHQTRELISARETSPEHINKDLSRLGVISHGMRVSTRHINSTGGTSSFFGTVQDVTVRIIL